MVTTVVVSVVAVEVAGTSAEVTTIKAVSHTKSTMVAGNTMVATEGASVIPSTSSYTMPCMTATIGVPEVGTTEVEVGAMRIAGIDAKVPVASVPVKRTIEIACCTEGAILPVEQDITQVGVQYSP